MTNHVGYYLWLSSSFCAYSGCCLLAYLLAPAAGMLMIAGMLIGGLGWMTKKP